MRELRRTAANTANALTTTCDSPALSGTVWPSSPSAQACGTGSVWCFLPGPGSRNLSPAFLQHHTWSPSHLVTITPGHHRHTWSPSPHLVTITPGHHHHTWSPSPGHHHHTWSPSPHLVTIRIPVLDPKANSSPGPAARLQVATPCPRPRLGWTPAMRQPGPVIHPLWASAALSVKWGQTGTDLPRLWRGPALRSPDSKEGAGSTQTC